MPLRLWDFDTCECGKSHRDWPITSAKIPKTIKCDDCGERVGWIRHRGNKIHRTLSSLYTGRPDPQTGEVYESYEDKKRILKERGLVEGDIERFEDIEDDVAARMEQSRQRDPNVLIADSLEDITQRIDTDRVDRRHTGSIMGRDGQNPETGLIDSWREL